MFARHQTTFRKLLKKRHAKKLKCGINLAEQYFQKKGKEKERKKTVVEVRRKKGKKKV